MTIVTIDHASRCPQLPALINYHMVFLDLGNADTANTYLILCIPPPKTAPKPRRVEPGCQVEVPWVPGGVASLPLPTSTSTSPFRLHQTCYHATMALEPCGGLPPFWQRNGNGKRSHGSLPRACERRGTRRSTVSLAVHNGLDGYRAQYQASPAAVVGRLPRHSTPSGMYACHQSSAAAHCLCASALVPLAG